MTSTNTLRAILSALVVTGAVAGCSSSEKTSAPTTTMAEAGTTGDSPVEVKGSGGNTSVELKSKTNQELTGKTVAYLPVAMGISLTEEWWVEIQAGAAASGMKAVIRDSNWSTQAETQALAAMIAEKPAVLIVHNPNVQLLSKQLEQAEKAGIYVVQVNMVSNYKTDSYVGVDWVKLGEDMANDLVKQCGTGSGKSGKIAIIQGELTSATSLDQIKGAMPIFEKDKAIKVVSNQAAMWDATKAHDIMATVLQQNKDLCGVYGFWDTMTLGASQAIKEAGMTDKIAVLASGDGARSACDSVTSGAITSYYNYDAKAQGRDLINSAKMLLQTGAKPGAMKTAIYSPFTVITKENVKPTLCFDLPSKK